MTTTPSLDLSVVVPTFNRGSLLKSLLERLLSQDAAGISYEIVLVDNNSTDNTRAVVEACIAADTSGRLRYVFEPRQGVSHARNTGGACARAGIIAFLDDDGIPCSSWVREMKAAFDAYPQADCIGGRVRARWTTPCPSWLTGVHMGPVALQDRAHQAWISKSSASACLLTANLGIRRAVLLDAGGFSPAYPRNQDRELELRLWRAGKLGLYLPSIEVVVDVPAERLTKQYHRRWQATTGAYHALMRFRDTVDKDGRLVDESAHTRRLLGSPLFLYRECLKHGRGWVASLVSGKHDRRFFHETRLWYCASFFWTRAKTDVIPRLHAGFLRTAPRP